MVHQARDEHLPCHLLCVFQRFHTVLKYATLTLGATCNLSASSVLAIVFVCHVVVSWNSVILGGGGVLVVLLICQRWILQLILCILLLLSWLDRCVYSCF